MFGEFAYHIVESKTIFLMLFADPTLKYLVRACKQKGNAELTQAPAGTKKLIPCVAGPISVKVIANTQIATTAVKKTDIGICFRPTRLMNV